MMPAALQRLIKNLDVAVRAPPEHLALGVTAALRDSIAENTWLPPERRRASHDNYVRHVLYGDPGGRFSILALVWGQGQKSPVHGHYAWCGVGVYRGVLTEILYEETAGTGPSPLRTLRREAGTLSFDPALSGIHRLVNDSGDIAISLHVYGVGKDRVSTGVNRIFGCAARQP
jgi:predicted metal-dependent enzyme (double-stranded beta helix superfamily)